MNTPTLNKLPRIIDGPGVYVLRNGKRALIVEVRENPNNNTTAFWCMGKIGKVVRGKLTFRGYRGWHVSGRYLPVACSPLDIISKERTV